MCTFWLAGKINADVLTSILISINILAISHATSSSLPMYVCLCQGVTDGQIRDAIYEGCCNYREVRESLGVGTQCGKCACMAKQMVRDTLGELQGSQAALAYSTAFVAA